MKKVLVVLGVVIIIYIFWTKSGRNEIVVNAYKPIEYFPVFKKDPTTANIVGMQPFMTNLDYQNKNTFYKKMDFYMEEAQKKSWFNKNTTVVFPEHIASWLVAANEKKSIYTATKIDDAMKYVVLANLPGFLTYYFNSEASDKVTDAVFQMKAKQMANIYQFVYSKLAKKYQVNIVAGSIFLPNPSIKEKKLVINKGPIFNMTAIFKPDGEIEPELVKKRYPISTELPFCVKNEEPLPTYRTTTGNLGIVICADAWHGDIYEELDKDNANTIIAPSYSTGYGIWVMKWHGYNGSENPEEINKEDINNLTLGEAWHKYTIRRIENTNIKTGITVFLRGNIWDLGTDGSSFIYRNNKIESVPLTDKPVIFNVEI